MESGDLQAGISTCDYKHFALEIGESVRMESHVQNEDLSQCVNKKQIIQYLELSSMFFMIGKYASKSGYCYDLYTALVE